MGGIPVIKKKRYVSHREHTKKKLDALLDFGHEEGHLPHPLVTQSKRLNDLASKIEDLTARIERLSKRL